MNFQDAIRSGFRNYVTFSGRASRSEYWYWVLFALLVAIASSIIDHAMFPFASTGPIEGLTYRLVVADRLHGDRDHPAAGLGVHARHGRGEPVRPRSVGGSGGQPARISVIASSLPNR